MRKRNFRVRNIFLSTGVVLFSIITAMCLYVGIFYLVYKSTPGISEQFLEDSKTLRIHCGNKVGSITRCEPREMGTTQGDCESGLYACACITDVDCFWFQFPLTQQEKEAK